MHLAIDVCILVEGNKLYHYDKSHAYNNIVMLRTPNYICVIQHVNILLQCLRLMSTRSSSIFCGELYIHRTLGLDVHC